MGLLSSISSAVFGQTRGAPAYFGSQTNYLAGPLYLDAFAAKRAPSPWELIEQYKSLIYACVQLNSLGVARCPLKLYTDGTKGPKAREVSGPRSIRRATYGHLKRSGYLQRSAATQEDVQEITKHPLIDALDHPDPEGYFSREDILGLLSAYCDVVGVAYLKMDPAGRNVPPLYLWPIQSQYLYDVKTPGTPLIQYYQYFADRYRPDELLRFRVQLSLRDPYGRGYSPTYAALQYAQSEDKFVALQDQIFGMGPRPNLLVSAKDATMPMGEAERDRYRQDLLRQHARGSAGGVLVTSGAVDVKPLTYAPVDLGGITLSDTNLERICNVFGIPVAYFTKETNLANLQAAESQHARTAIEPRCKSIAGTLTRLVRKYDERLFFAFDPCVEEDMEKDAKVKQIYLQTGLLTINEALEDMPYEDKPWGEEPWLPGTLVQPTMAQQRHDQGLEQGAAQMENDKKTTEHAISEGVDRDRSDGDADRGSNNGRAEDRSHEAVDTGTVDERFDAILTALERSVGL